VTGSASYANGSFVAASAGTGFAGAAEGFRFIYARVLGDAKLAARVVASQGATGRQAGIALRTSLEAGAAETALVADETGVVLVNRAGPSQTPAQSRLVTTTAPVMLQLDRRGSTMAAAFSTDGGATWKTAATVSSSLGSDLYAGLVVAGGPSGGLAAAAFDRLSLVSVPANRPPEVSLSEPVTGQRFVLGNPVAIIATATDPDDLVARVDFRVNGVTIASDSTAPYLATWAPNAAGAYSIVAVASDFDGAVTESSPALVTVVTSNLEPTTPAPGQSPGGGWDSGSTPSQSPAPTPAPAPPPAPAPGATSWRLEFGASPDHVSVDYYELEVYLAGLAVPVRAVNIGKPAVDGSGICSAEISWVIEALPVGQYAAVVRAVSYGGSTGSAPYSFAR
jgi:hypothetical protein